MIDLHTHTTFSDGSLTPFELVERAAWLGIRAIAITDHDTVDGVPEALAAGEQFGVEVVPGVEINVEYERMTMDMLGFFLNGLPDEELKVQLAELRHYRNERNTRMIARLGDLGLPLTQEDLAAAAGQGAIGRPHIAAAMVRRGYVQTVPEGFQRYLRRGAPGYVDRRRLSLSAAVHLLNASGGVSVIAHPGLIHTDGAGLGHVARAAARAGVDGFECYHPSHDEATVATCVEVATACALAITGGSDYHGVAKPEVGLGKGPGGMTFPYAMLSELKARAARLQEAREDATPHSGLSNIPRGV